MAPVKLAVSIGWSADMQFYKRLCPSVGPLVHWSVCWSMVIESKSGRTSISDTFLSRVHVTLQPAMSVGRSVHWAVPPSVFLSLCPTIRLSIRPFVRPLVALCHFDVYRQFLGYSSCPTAQLVYFITAHYPSASTLYYPLVD